MTRYLLMEIWLRDSCGLIVGGLKVLGEFDGLDAITEHTKDFERGYDNIDWFVVVIHADGTVQSLIDNGYGEWVDKP
jgi:hypothetical protein